MTRVGNSLRPHGVIWRPYARLQAACWNSSLLTPCVYPTSVSGSSCGGGTGGRCPCSGAELGELSLPLCSPYFHPRELSLGGQVEAECPFSSVPVGTREVPLPNGALWPFWVGSNTPSPLQLQTITLKMQIRRGICCHLAQPVLQLLSWLSLHLSVVCLSSRLYSNMCLSGGFNLLVWRPLDTCEGGLCLSRGRGSLCEESFPYTRR